MSQFGSFLKSFSKDLNELLEALYPYTKRIYIVGGAVRDILQGIEPRELDIEIYDIDLQTFEVVSKKLGALGVGKSFFVYKWRDFDLSLPRIESKVAHTHQGFEVALCDDEKIASKRRDFTMNALMYNLLTKELLDFWGGKDDIDKKIVRFVDETSFQEDSLRVLRGLQFVSRFGFAIDQKTLLVMARMNLNQISKTRIFWELEKLFCAKYPEIGLFFGYKIGMWQKLFKVKFDFSYMYIISVRLLAVKPFVQEHLRKYLFFYIFFNELHLDIKEALKQVDAPKEYVKYLLHSPYKKLPLNNKELLKIAIDIPLKEWLGICQKGLFEKANELGIYEKKFDGGITSNDVLRDGFKGRDIGEELRRRKQEKIKSLI